MIVVNKSMLDYLLLRLVHELTTSLHNPHVRFLTFRVHESHNIHLMFLIRSVLLLRWVRLGRQE